MPRTNMVPLHKILFLGISILFFCICHFCNSYPNYHFKYKKVSCIVDDRFPQLKFNRLDTGNQSLLMEILSVLGSEIFLLSWNGTEICSGSSSFIDLFLRILCDVFFVFRLMIVFFLNPMQGYFNPSLVKAVTYSFQIEYNGTWSP